MIKPTTFSISDYLNNTFSCNCGKSHHTEIKDIDISEDAINNLEYYIKKYDHKNIILVSDKNTYKVAGQKINDLLHDGNLYTKSFVFNDETVIPDEKTIGELLIAIEDDCDLIIAIGAGTINDICKYMSYKLNIPYFIVATAPSMDGFASIGAALIVNNLKTTYSTHSPEVIIGDINILKNAPFDMIIAGFGDILGKYTCLTDWKLSQIINDEYYCETVVEMVKISIQKVVETTEKINSRDSDAIYNLTEALILTGIAMSYVGNSRPASGSEHHISHYWEMKFLFEKKEPILHGIKVGVSTIAILKLYDFLQELNIDFDKSRNKSNLFDLSKWENNIKRTFTIAAPAVIELEKSVGKNDRKKQLKRINTIEKNWPKILQVIKDDLPKAKKIEEILSKVSAPINPKQIGIDYKTMNDSIIVAKEVRDRYTVLQIIWDLGISEDMAEKIGLYFKNVKKI